MIDLHLHLDGSLTPEEVLHLAELSGVTLPSEDPEVLRKLLTAEPDCESLGEYLEKFDLPLKVLQLKETLELSVYGLVKRLAAQGLCYGEIRFAPQFHTSAGLTQTEAVEAAITGLKRAVKEFGMPAQLILCCMRGDQNQEENLETVRVAGKFLGEGVCAVDLAGNEAAFPTESFAEVFAAARERQIPVIIHAGEAAGPESVRQALGLGAVRIGHGIHSLEDPELMEMLRERRTVLELCYTSNLQTKAVARREDYPLKRFLDAGIAATLNTDNMTVSGTTLKREYQLVRDELGVSEADLERAALYSVEGAFVSPEEKKQMAERIRREFAGWIK